MSPFSLVLVHLKQDIDRVNLLVYLRCYSTTMSQNQFSISVLREAPPLYISGSGVMPGP